MFPTGKQIQKYLFSVPLYCACDSIKEISLCTLSHLLEYVNSPTSKWEPPRHMYTHGWRSFLAPGITVIHAHSVYDGYHPSRSTELSGLTRVIDGPRRWYQDGSVSYVGFPLRQKLFFLFLFPLALAIIHVLISHHRLSIRALYEWIKPFVNVIHHTPWPMNQQCQQAFESICVSPCLKWRRHPDGLRYG